LEKSLILLATISMTTRYTKTTPSTRPESGGDAVPTHYLSKWGATLPFFFNEEASRSVPESESNAKAFGGTSKGRTLPPKRSAGL
jgi:hypothetical protein